MRDDCSANATSLPGAGGLALAGWRLCNIGGDAYSIFPALPDKDFANINVATAVTEVSIKFLRSVVLPRLSQGI